MWRRSASRWPGCRWRLNWRRRAPGTSPRRPCATALRSQLKLLTGGARDLPARHQTLRGGHRLEL